MIFADAAAVFLLVIGLFFFIGGTAGLLRFPDAFTRLHALSKADNLGLGFVAAAVALESGSWFTALKLLLLWLLVLLASGAVSFLIARRALHDGMEPWRPER